MCHIWIIVEECGERKKFCKVFRYDVEELLARYAVELIGEVEEDGGACGWLLSMLGSVNEFLDC
jgi:hypothetical protein